MLTLINNLKQIHVHALLVKLKASFIFLEENNDIQTDAMTNSTEKISSRVTNESWNNLHLDEYSIYMKAAFNSIAAAILVFSCVSLIAFKRTRGTPQTAKFLSSALIIFDILTTFSFALRKFITNSDGNIIIQFIGLGWSFLAYINVTIMSLERLVIFQWPNFYLRHVTFTLARNISITIWSVIALSYTIQFIRCFYLNALYESSICVALLASDYIRITFPVAALISLLCFAIILAIIKKQTKKTTTKQKNMLRQNKPTVAVFICVISFILTTSLYLCFALIVTFDYDTRRLVFDALAMVNQLIDTCVYVMWYQETRLELVKMFSCLHPDMTTKAEKMKIKIFRIVTYDKECFRF